VTRGGSVLQAVHSVEEAGCEVIAVLSLVDRLEGGRERILSEAKTYMSLYDLDDFGSDIERVCQQVSNPFEKHSMAASA
jgi:orotate phosphoribosyltransferase